MSACKEPMARDGKVGGTDTEKTAPEAYLTQQPAHEPEATAEGQRQRQSAPAETGWGPQGSGPLAAVEAEAGTAAQEAEASAGRAEGSSGWRELVAGVGEAAGTRCITSLLAGGGGGLKAGGTEASRMAARLVSEGGAERSWGPRQVAAHLSYGAVSLLCQHVRAKEREGEREDMREGERQLPSPLDLWGWPKAVLSLQGDADAMGWLMQYALAEG